MTKCSVGRTRNRSAGSIGPAARAVPERTATSAKARVAVSDRVTPLRLSRLRMRVARPTRSTRENDAQDERGDAKETSTNEEEGVSIEQRAPGRQPLDHHSRKSFRKLSDVRVR